MIPPIPPNFGFSMLAVPVWVWEQVAAVESPEAPAPAPSPDSAETAAVTSTAADQPSGPVSLPSPPPACQPADQPPPAERRLVFKGYEWRPAIEWRLYPASVCERCLGSVEANRAEADQAAKDNDPARLQRADARAAKRPDPAHDAQELAGRLRTSDESDS